MSFFVLRDRFLLEGIMPERALLRLRRAGITLFHAKKIKKNQILFSVNRKDTEKVFAIYPNVCYNISVYSPYTVKKLGAEGLAKPLDFIKNRLGLFLGGIVFLATLLFFDSFVFAVEFTATDVYARETYQTLEENGIRLFAPYQQGKEDWICSKLLSLPDVEYCSLKKVGYRLQVELRLTTFEEKLEKTGALITKRNGKILSITALRGTPLKKTGDEVRAGETLVADWFSTEDGRQVCVEPIARVAIACEYEAEIEATTAEEAFANAYLALELSPLDTLTQKSVEKVENAENVFCVKLAYTVIEKINL